MNKVIIMRGLSGAGKTTWVSKNYPWARIISADEKRIDMFGVYRFERAQNARIHNETFKEYVECVIKNEPLIVVDNTNASLWEVAPYYRVAESFGCDVTIVELRADPEACASRNTHGTPAVTIGMMFSAIINDKLPAWWRREVYDETGKLMFKVPQ